jgi:hypothetical protein
VVRVQGSCVIGPVTIDAIHRETGVMVVDVAIRTQDCAVCAGQLESRGVVIERSRFPCGRRVAGLAEVAEIRCRMVRVRRLLKLRLMALVTVDVHQLIIAVHMAGLTGRGYMPSG